MKKLQRRNSIDKILRGSRDKKIAPEDTLFPKKKGMKLSQNIMNTLMASGIYNDKYNEYLKQN